MLICNCETTSFWNVLQLASLSPMQLWALFSGRTTLCVLPLPLSLAIGIQFSVLLTWAPIPILEQVRICLLSLGLLFAPSPDPTEVWLWEVLVELNLKHCLSALVLPWVPPTVYMTHTYSEDCRGPPLGPTHDWGSQRAVSFVLGCGYLICTLECWHP